MKRQSICLGIRKWSKRTYDFLHHQHTGPAKLSDHLEHINTIRFFSLLDQPINCYEGPGPTYSSTKMKFLNIFYQLEFQKINLSSFPFHFKTFFKEKLPAVNDDRWTAERFVHFAANCLDERDQILWIVRATEIGPVDILEVLHVSQNVVLSMQAKQIS